MRKCNSSDVRRWSYFVFCFLFIHLPLPTLVPHFQVAQTLQPFFKRMAIEFPLQVEPETQMSVTIEGAGMGVGGRGRKGSGEVQSHDKKDKAVDIEGRGRKKIDGERLTGGFDWKQWKTHPK
jgi:hypothetical protein